jgi:hypothetical protein
MRYSPNGQSPDLHQEVALDDLTRKQQSDDDTIERAFGNMTEDECARVETRENIRGDGTPTDSISTTDSIR